MSGFAHADAGSPRHTCSRRDIDKVQFGPQRLVRADDHVLLSQIPRMFVPVDHHPAVHLQHGRVEGDGGSHVDREWSAHVLLQLLEPLVADRAGRDDQRCLRRDRLLDNGQRSAIAPTHYGSRMGNDEEEKMSRYLATCGDAFGTAEFRIHRVLHAIPKHASSRTQLPAFPALHPIRDLPAHRV